MESTKVFAVPDVAQPALPLVAILLVCIAPNPLGSAIVYRDVPFVAAVIAVTAPTVRVVAVLALILRV